MKGISLVLLAAALPACDPDPPQADPPAGWLPIPAAHSTVDEEDYPAWAREGRPAVFEGREWVPFGDPIYNIAPEPLGRFEGTALYGEPTDLPPYERLFVPLPGDNWLVLVPRQTVPGPTQSGERLAPPGGQSQD